MRRQRNRRRFEDVGVNPMNYISNLSDAMLVLAVGGVTNMYSIVEAMTGADRIVKP